jgi:hypothetical protein
VVQTAWTILLFQGSDAPTLYGFTLSVFTGESDTSHLRVLPQAVCTNKLHLEQGLWKPTADLRPSVGLTELMGEYNRLKPFDRRDLWWKSRLAWRLTYSLDFAVMSFVQGEHDDAGNVVCWRLACGAF